MGRGTEIMILPNDYARCPGVIRHELRKMGSDAA